MLECIKYKMKGHLRKALARNKQTSAHIKFPSSFLLQIKKIQQERLRAWASFWWAGGQGQGFVWFLIPDSHSRLLGMRLLRETFKSRTWQPDQIFLAPRLQKVKHHQWHGIALSSHLFLLQRCFKDWDSSMLLLEKPTGRWSQTVIQWFGHQPTKSLLPTKIFLMNEPEHQQHAKGHFDPGLSISVTMSCLSQTWWDTQGNRLHDHQVIFDSELWCKAWSFLCRKPTSVFCNLARNVLRLQHTKQSPFQWHKEEMQTLISTAQAGKRSTGGYWLGCNTHGAAGNHHTGWGQIPHTMINEESKQLCLFGTFNISPCSEDPQLLSPISFCWTAQLLHSFLF